MARAPKRVHSGMRIHYWTVVAKMPDDRKTISQNLRKRLKVKCECGTVQVLPQYYLYRGNPKKHCGCRNKGMATLHNLEYRVWYMMNVRCQNPEHRSYKDYGGRGIAVDPRWHKSNPHGFRNFLADMGPRVHLGMTLERLDVNGPYALEFNGKRQCIWATWTQQAANKRHLLPPPEEDAQVIEELKATNTLADPTTQTPQDIEGIEGTDIDIPLENVEDVEQEEGEDGETAET